MKVLDLFSGIGGFSLGLERAGMTTVAFCEIDPFCRRVLAKHWPGVPIYDDVRDVTAARLGADGIAVDVICGGFPCQDISIAGKGAGLAGERSGLWREYARIVGELRPRYVIVENVAALLHRGLGDVLGDLAALGYDAEWHCIPASAVGAPHVRDRVWIVAHADGEPVRNEGYSSTASAPSSRERKEEERKRFWTDAGAGRRGSYVAHADSAQRQGVRVTRRVLEEHADSCRAGWWAAESDVGRVAHGIPGRVDRLHALGNAVVPQIPELIGRAILQAEAA
jgi:DNA (cytosine-5)-methyltransferase 1